jgi:hypothetical protein
MDVHQASISIAVRDDTGKPVMECVIETKAPSWDSSEDCWDASGSRFEEGTSAA